MKQNGQAVILFSFKVQGVDFEQYCYCKETDFDVYGVRLVTMQNVIKGVSDDKWEAKEDFKFNLLLSNNSELHSAVSSSTCRIIEKKGGIIALN